jgi:hypothetical protein
MDLGRTGSCAFIVFPVGVRLSLFASSSERWGSSLPSMVLLSPLMNALSNALGEILIPVTKDPWLLWIWGAPAVALARICQFVCGNIAKALAQCPKNNVWSLPPNTDRSNGGTIVQWKVYKLSPCGYYASTCDTVAPISIWWQAPNIK